MRRMLFSAVLTFFVVAGALLPAQATDLRRSDTFRMVSGQTEGEKQASHDRYWNELTIRLMGLLTMEQKFFNAFNMFGFHDPSLDTGYAANATTNDVPEGYAFGGGVSYRPSKYFEIFLDGTYHYSTLLIGLEGDRLVGPNMPLDWIVDGGTPVLTKDVYYGAKAYFLKAGVRLFIPVSKSFEPWVAAGFGPAKYEAAFADKKMSRAFGDIVSGMTTGYSLSAGLDLNLLINNKQFLALSLFADLGRLSSKSLHFDNLIWEGWSVDISHAPVVLPLRLGLALAVGM
ncbi:MAG: hypothetical protein FJY83_03570 [Candidatus Aminicenantes bacterium]|nr:hypothetical protein [Candidatus Aminicenantes bacterium]